MATTPSSLICIPKLREYDFSLFYSLLIFRCSSGQVYLINEVEMAQAMQQLDFDNMPVDPRFEGL